MPNDFAIDIAKIRDEAKKHLTQGPVMPSDTSSVPKVIAVLQTVVASEMVCYLRYTQNAIVHGGVLDRGVDLMVKPYPIDKLAKKIREILDR